MHGLVFIRVLWCWEFVVLPSAGIIQNTLIRSHQ